MEGLMVHCGGKVVGYNEAIAVPVPPTTRTYTPVPNKDLIDFIRARIAAVLGIRIIAEQWALSKNGQQLFGIIVLKGGLVIGVRSSYNKTLSVGLAVGMQVFVCDNLCFSGDSLTYMRKHTLNVWRDIRHTLDSVLQESEVYHERLIEETNSWRNIALSDDQGYEYLGLDIGQGVLTPTQANVAFTDWKKPRYEEFAPRTAWSLYNCFTEGLKKGSAGTGLNRYTTAHDWFREVGPGSLPPFQRITIGPANDGGIYDANN